MKKLAALLGTLVISTSIQAEEKKRDIYDVMYLPNAGTAYGFTTLGFGQIKRESDDLGDLDLEGFLIDQTLGYALSDRFSIQANLNYANVEADPEGGRKYDSAKGVSDPRFTARFRAVDEAFRLDFVGGMRINFQDRTEKLNGDRNNSQGGHEFFIGPEIGVKAEHVQWFLGARFVRNLEAETEYETNIGDVKVEDDANNELNVYTSLLHRIYEKNFLRWNAAAYFREEFGNDREEILGKTAPNTLYDVGLEYQYAASEDILVRLGGNYEVYKVRSGQIDDIQGWNAYLGANYQF